MTGMRRLEPPKKDDLYERGRTSSVRAFEVDREAFDQVQRERPELIRDSNTGVMALVPQGSRAWLCYGFDNVEAFRRQFLSMFDSLRASLKAGEARSSILLWFSDPPNRPYLEPVLAACLFTPLYEWVRMDLVALPDEPASGDEIAPGFLLRPVVASEFEAMAAVDVVAFAGDAWEAEDFIEAANRASATRVIEERGGRRIVGYIGLRTEDHTGKVTFLAVLPEYQRRGFGEAIMRWALAWFRQQGMRRAWLNTHADNVPAIALYRKLGFVLGQRGLVYRRPTRPDEIEALLAKSKGTFIKFGGWR